MVYKQEITYNEEVKLMTLSLTEKVLNIMNTPEHIRNLATVAHIDILGKHLPGTRAWEMCCC